MYEAIKQRILNNFPNNQSYDGIGYEEAYELLYRWVIRLQDMDDFSNSVLASIQERIDSGLSFDTAFQQTIDNDYPSASFEYFQDAFNKYKDDLEEEFKKAMASSSPSRTWRASISWMFNHATITVDGTDYTLKQLQEKLEKGDYQDE